MEARRATRDEHFAFMVSPLFFEWCKQKLYPIKYRVREFGPRGSLEIDKEGSRP
jgi:hypothetical protein